MIIGPKNGYFILPDPCSPEQLPDRVRVVDVYVNMMFIFLKIKIAWPLESAPARC